jgi:hypothetical protein
MGLLRKAFYAIIGIPAAAIAAEYFYTIKCVETEPRDIDRLVKYSPLVKKKISDNAARLCRVERVVPIATLQTRTDNLDEESLSRKLAKQIWLTGSYRPQQIICERAFKNIKEPASNLTYEELKNAPIRLGTDISQFLVLSAMEGGFVQFEPKVPKDQEDFKGPGGPVCVDVSRRGGSIVFALETATIPLKTVGQLELKDRFVFHLHQMYLRLLLEGGVRRVIRGGNE